MKQEQIKIDALYKELYQKLKAMSILSAFYIGKTDNVENRSQEHKERDNYPYTIKLATGLPEVINEGEIYLIDKFFESDLPIKNRIRGGSGNFEVNSLYISYRCDYSKIRNNSELDDDDLRWDTTYVLVK